jgi:ubiquinone/menaquinone biosynthesis C-methylase UbiE
VLNVSAGAGSYEPTDRMVVALEPSQTMIDQRTGAAAPAVRGSAEALPFPDGAFDVPLAILTIHHWSDPALGLAELQRVSRRQVVLTWCPLVFSQRMWLVAEYLPEVFEHEATVATERGVLELLDSARSEPLPAVRLPRRRPRRVLATA